MPQVTASRLISERFTADLKGDNTGEFIWRVQTDGRMSPNEILEAAYTASPDPVPRRGVYAGNGIYVLQLQVQMELQGNKQQWLVSASCGKWPSDGQTNPSDAVEDPAGVFNNPLTRKCVWWMERQPETEEVDRDATGKAFLNSAGQPFDTKLVIERHLPVIVCQKNFAKLEDILEINEHENKTNSGRFRGYAQDRVLFRGAEASQPQYENDIEYYTATMRFVCNNESWQPSLLNRGFAYLDKPKAQGGVLVPVTNADGSQAVEPVLLAANGTKLAENAAPTYSDFTLYLRTDFDDFTGDP